MYGKYVRGEIDSYGDNAHRGEIPAYAAEDILAEAKRIAKSLKKQLPER